MGDTNRVGVELTERQLAPAQQTLQAPDTYVRPANADPAQNMDVMGKFLVELSPTLSKSIDSFVEARNVEASQKILEQYQGKSVEDFNAIFQNKDSYNKFADDFNSLMAQHQKNLGTSMGTKYASDISNKLALESIDGNKSNLDPVEYEKWVTGRTQELLKEAAKERPDVFALPHFGSEFSTKMDAVHQKMTQTQIGDYGEIKKAEVMSTLSTLSYQISSDGMLTPDERAAKIADLIKTNYKSFKSIQLTKAVIEGVALTGDIKFLQSLVDKKVNILSGPNGEALNNSYQAQNLLREAIKKANTDKFTQVQQAIDIHGKLDASVNAFLDKGGKGYSSWVDYVKGLGIDEPTIKTMSPTAFGAAQTRYYKELQALNTKNPVQIEMAAFRASQLVAQQGESVGEQALLNMTRGWNPANQAQAFALLRQAKEVNSSRFMGNVIYELNQQAGKASGVLNGGNAAKKGLGERKKGAENFAQSFNSGQLPLNPLYNKMDKDTQAKILELSKSNSIVGLSSQAADFVSSAVLDASEKALKEKGEAEAKKFSDGRAPFQVPVKKGNSSPVTVRKITKNN